MSSFRHKLDKEKATRRHLMALMRNCPAREHMTGGQMLAVYDAIDHSETMIRVLQISVSIEEQDLRNSLEDQYVEYIDSVPHDSLNPKEPLSYERWLQQEHGE